MIFNNSYSCWGFISLIRDLLNVSVQRCNFHYIFLTELTNLLIYSIGEKYTNADD